MVDRLAEVFALREEVSRLEEERDDLLKRVRHHAREGCGGCDVYLFANYGETVNEPQLSEEAHDANDN